MSEGLTLGASSFLLNCFLEADWNNFDIYFPTDLTHAAMFSWKAQTATVSFIWNNSFLSLFWLQQQLPPQVPEYLDYIRYSAGGYGPPMIFNL